MTFDGFARGFLFLGGETSKKLSSLMFGSNLLRCLTSAFLRRRRSRDNGTSVKGGYDISPPPGDVWKHKMTELANRPTEVFPKSCTRMPYLFGIFVFHFIIPTPKRVRLLLRCELCNSTQIELCSSVPNCPLLRKETINTHDHS